MDKKVRQRLWLFLVACAVVAVFLAFVPYMRERVYVWRLSSGDADVRASAARALGQMRAISAIPDLLRCMTDNDTQVRAEALGALARIGEPALPHLFRALASGEPADRLNAATALFRAVVMSPSPSAIEPLAKALADTEESVVRFAAKALQCYGADARPAVPALLQAVKRRDAAGLVAAEVTFWIDRQVALEEAVPILQAMSENVTNVHRKSAADLLEWMDSMVELKVENPAIRR